ncbi:MAG: argS [Gammaproteobacteria bacterium]|jgi:arginyl-tRNA synthetase|nr:argS [Gammaproteobacteria bacterium]
MKQEIGHLIESALAALRKQGLVPADIHPNIQIEHTRDKQFGDFACNIAMLLAKPLQLAPRAVAEHIIAHLPQHPLIRRVDIAGPGFINFFVETQGFLAVIPRVLEQKERYGNSALGQNESVYLEFVSANPTGPLHVGHGRGAAYGDTLGNLLSSQGYAVHREYYVNDAGRQMNILALSVWLRYLELCGETFVFPTNAYKGDYVIAIAQQLKEMHQNELQRATTAWWHNITPDEGETNGDKDKHVDDLGNAMKKTLGASNYDIIFNLALNTVLADIRDDLDGFGVHFDQWFSEKQLMQQGLLQQGIDQLKVLGHTYEQAGNLWFKATEFGDEKDRVLVRKNGQPTYFASDVAYHVLKFSKATRIIDILGADHHGYAPRIRAVLRALNLDCNRLAVELIQFAVLYRGKERVQMSTRSGSFVTLRALREEVGRDAARFFYVARRHEQHMDFDLDLAKSKSNDNPVYYIQYAHARICSVFRQLQAQGLEYNEREGLAHLEALNLDEEKELCESLNRYPALLEQAALQYEPHLIAHFLKTLAAQFHTYYNSHQFLVTDSMLRNARLCLIGAIRYVLQHGLTLLGVSYPEVM